MDDVVISSCRRRTLLRAHRGSPKHGFKQPERSFNQSLVFCESFDGYSRPFSLFCIWSVLSRFLHPDSNSTFTITFLFSLCAPFFFLLSYFFLIFFFTLSIIQNLILWGGLFAHAPKIGDFGGVGGSNTPNIMTLTRSVYRYDDSDKSARPTLLGVVAFDLHLRTLKDILDAVSENLGRTSFPLLVTPFGDTIYHVLMTKFKKRDLFHVGVDVSNYEYFQDISTPESERSFDNTVRPAFLSGELGNKRIRVLRALPAGDAATEGFEGREIDTTYFYRGVTGWDLRLALVVDQFDLQQTMMHPRGGGSSNSSRVITSQLKDYVGNDNIKNMELAELVPNIKFINNDNCPDSTSGAAFGNCQPDEYCARVLRGEEHPVGVIPGRPVCVDTSTCECEIHRWPVGLTAKRVACMHVAPKSLIVPQNAYDLQNSNADKSDLTYDMTKFLNLDRNSINPSRQRLRPDSIEHALTSAPIIQEWVADQVKGVHNDTVWLYYGSMTGMSIIFPPNVRILLLLFVVHRDTRG